MEADDFFAIIGPSGAGKSTLIRCINKLVEPSGGTVRFSDVDVTALRGRELRGLRRNIGMIFQEFNLIDRMSVMDNVLSGRLGYTGNLRTLFRAFPRADIEHALQRCCTGSGSRTTSTSAPTSSPAASASGSVSRGR